jgi:hypothetical protein
MKRIIYRFIILLLLEGEGNQQKWIAVSLANGLKGYIGEEYIRSPIGYRAIFEKKDGRWMLTALVAGD